MVWPVVELTVQDLTVAMEVAQLCRSAYRVEARLLGRPDLPPLSRTEHDIAQSATSFYGVLADDKVVGVIEVDTSGSGPVEICSLVTAPEHFRRGLARGLLGHVVARFGGRGIAVSTARANAPGLALYASCGFREERAWTTADGFDLVSLARAADTAGS